MDNLEIQLWDSMVVHRKTQLALHAKAHATVSSGANPSASHITDHDEVLTSGPYWIPKAQTFILSLHLDFHESITNVCDCGTDAVDVVADSIGTAELWSELGYDVCQLAVTRGDSAFGKNSPTIEMKMRCFDHRDDSTLDCPPDIRVVHLTSVRIDCLLKHASMIAPQPPNGSVHASKPDPIPVSSLDPSPIGGFMLPQASNDRSEGIGNCDQSSHREDTRLPSTMVTRIRFRETQKQDAFALSDDVLVRLVDAVLRKGICTDAMSQSPSINVVCEFQKLSLSEFAPNIFSRAYSNDFEQQAIFVRGLASILSSFSLSSRQSTIQSGALITNGADDVDNNGRRFARELCRKAMWMTLARGLRSSKSARRLTPLCPIRSVLSGTHSRQQTGICPSVLMQNLGSEDLWKRSAMKRAEDVYGEIPLTRQCPEIPASLDSFNECSISAVPSIDDVLDAAMSGYHDVHSAEEGQRELDIFDLLQESESIGGQIDERRNQTRSISPESDVSMLTALVRKVTHTVEQAHAVKTFDVIGGNTLLTQNVIRMHPPWTNVSVRDDVHSPSYDERGPSSQETAVSQWVGDILDREPSSISEPWTCCSDSCTALGINCKTAITDHELISVIQDTIYDSAEEENLLEISMTLSSSESERLTDSSLSDVLGNDHLLWHMWKRRASVAPRGEADIEDMKILYESDPDMKLFAKDWNMDNRDMGSSSNGEPMLQEMPSQLGKTSSSASPTADRRSYFTPSRSSSSSSSPAQTPSDAKLQRRGSMLKRLSWGGRSHSMESAGLNMTSLDGRDFEVKRRRTMEDYATMEKETNGDASNEMLF
ncbi:hypothetical protein LTR84_000568 [Exophiala bonariae]|uniref:Uncharacterized protein n=1 Tax=Exophiala bonariae TaxID=1690606 RepID=A0AAV9NQZ1_9EURO|nr:hypothetical protein LTR84_000568 [Exophiala bonariae]